jgi:hypothetical protein
METQPKTCPLCQSPMTDEEFCTNTECLGSRGCEMCESPLTGPNGTCSYELCPTTDSTKPTSRSISGLQLKSNPNADTVALDDCAGPRKPK